MGYKHNMPLAQGLISKFRETTKTSQSTQRENMTIWSHISSMYSPNFIAKCKASRVC